MSDSPRWHLDGLPGTTGIVEVMLYDDHLAAVAAVVTEEREAAARAMGLSTAYSASEALALLEAVAGIREASAHVISAEECDRRVDAAENDMALYAFNRALDKARERITARMATEPDIPRRTGMGYAVEEIDALIKEGRNTE